MHEKHAPRPSPSPKVTDTTKSRKQENLEILGREPILTRSGLSSGEQGHHTKTPRQVPRNLPRTAPMPATTSPRPTLACPMLICAFQQLHGAELCSASPPLPDAAPCA
jgi:hypothetical protein